MTSNPAPESHRFRKKSIQVSLFLDKDNGGVVTDFEGETTSISRKGMGARVDASSTRAKEIENDLTILEGTGLFGQFHVPWSPSNPNVSCLGMEERSQDAGFRRYFDMSFKNEINLARLVSGL